jgi:hypothetical protein
MVINQIKLIKQILTFSPRQGENETKTGRFLTGLLTKNRVKFKLQKFLLKIPQDLKAELTADGQKIPCQAVSFASGKIMGKNNLISSLSQAKKDFPFISFNPNCEAISASGRAINQPALAISRNDVNKLLKAKIVAGKVMVKPVKHQSKNILVGNLNSPQNLIFTHYDSVNLGATDNAAGVTVTLKLILDRPDLLKTNLFILSGNEELAYDFPVYWGYGYRVFEKKYLHLLKQAKKILIVDCVGNAKTQFLTDPYWINEGFPIKNIKTFLPKTAIVCGDIDKLMTVYHSNADNLSQLKTKYLNEAYKLILKKLL